MLARPMPCRAARMKNSGSLLARNAGKFELLESRCRQRGNLSPVFNRGRFCVACFAKLTVRRIMFELKPKKLEGHALEFAIIEPIARRSLRFGQSREKIREI